MNRRRFIARVSAGIVSACVVTKLPTAWIPAPVQRRAATEFLRHAYNTFTNGRAENHPQWMTAGRELYEAYESELMTYMRFIDTTDSQPPSLKFKSCRVFQEGSGWRVECHTSAGVAA